ncbi:MAG: Hsp33 family molecular chaperone HslO [SAR324 cluster bacterium]|nr:Hsp33 family molecular chaperone HslO [SAR324 cluster bacterium]MCH8885876.1 Hsp33 family molecular chaperone HslO [SAR324 cluster bacterium]
MTNSAKTAPAGDRLLRGHLPGKNLRFAVCQCAALCSEAIGRHRADWIAGRLLGEALTCGVLLSVTLKETERLTLRWEYPGPVGTILADTNDLAEVRGFPSGLQLMERAGALDAALGGNGRISAITSVPNKVLHTGITRGVFQDVHRDMAHLLSLSFQLETVLTVGLVIPPVSPIKVRSAIGIMVQPFPGADPMALEEVRREVENGDFREWLEMKPHPLEDVMERLSLKTGGWEVLGEIEPRFACGCSRDKVDMVLRMFDRPELEDMLEKDGGATVNCHFCAESYFFGSGDIEAMIRQSQTGHA